MASPRIVALLSLSIVLATAWGDALAADPPSKAAARPAIERRLALVIGNGAYADAPLRNPVNDANDFSAALTESGFEVTRLENANLRELRAALREFGDKLKKQGGVGLFYFAGHGVQVKGRNYLVPVGAQIEREDEVEFESLDANLVLEKLDSAANRFNIVIFDACRNNPFARSFRSSSRGLAQMDAPSGAVVAFATSPGSVASDGGGRNGLYSQHLIESVRRPGLKIEEVFKLVRAAVRRDSGGRQTPWESTSLEGDFYFHPVDLDSAEAARKQQEQDRLEAAVQIAIVQERERIRKEYELAQAKGAETLVATAAVRPVGAPSITSAPQSPAAAPAGAGGATVPPPGSSASAPGATGNVVGAGTHPEPPDSVGVASYPLELSPALKPLDWFAAPAFQDPAGAAPGLIVGSQAQRSIASPRIAIDDEWELLSIRTDAAGRGAARPVVFRITASEVTTSTLTVSRVTLDKPGGDPVEGKTVHPVSASLEWLFGNANELSGQVLYEPADSSKPRKILAFPLEINKSWSYSYDYILYPSAEKRRNELKSRVVGWEKIVVPAGTFWALKIEQSGWSSDMSPGSYLNLNAPRALQVNLTLWYSPEVKYIVKSIYEQRTSPSGTAAFPSGFTSTTQLVRYATEESRTANATAQR